MMVPRPRLLRGLGLWVVPLNLALVLDPGHAAAWLAAMAPLFLAAAWDAWRARGLLAGLRVELPPASRHTLRRDAVLRTALRGTSPRPLRVTLWIDLPPQLRPMAAPLPADLPAGEVSLEVPVPVRPERRGPGRISSWRLFAASPLGLWDVEARGAAACEVKVYPDLAGAGGFASPDRLALIGSHRGKALGRGWEFEKLREYLHGDDFHDIHWKATARRGVPVTKVFRVEDSRQVYALVDVSRFGAIPLPDGEGTRPLEILLRAALRLGLAAERQGDRYGLMVYGDRPETFLRAGKGKTHYGFYRDALYAVEPREGSPDYADLFASIRLRVRKRALLLFLCDLSDPAVAESFLANVGMINRRHLVAVHMIRPPGIRPVFAGPPAAGPEELYDRLADQAWLQDLAHAARALKRQGVALRTWDPARYPLEAVSGYLESRRGSAAG